MCDVIKRGEVSVLEKGMTGDGHGDELVAGLGQIYIYSVVVVIPILQVKHTSKIVTHVQLETML